MIQISVIIPTHNRKIALQNCLTALDLQSFPKDSYEVIVVDDSSNDGTASTVKECQKKCTIQIKYLHYKRSSKHFHASKIRNFGAKHAKGKILLFLDCDMIADPFLIQEHYNHHCKNHACAVMGYRFELPPILLPILGEHFIKNHFHKIKQFPLRLDMRDGIWLNPLFRKNIKKNWRPWLGFYSCNISISKKGFQAVGQFDENFKGWGHEDLELGYRLSKAGIKLVFERNAIGFHQVHALKPLNRQRESRLNINYFHRKHPELEVELLCKGVERILSLNRDLQTLPSMDAYSQNQQAHLKKILSNYRSGTNLLLGGNNPLLTAFLSPKIILEFRKKTRNKLKKRFPKTSVWPILGYNIPWDDNCFDNTVVTEFLSFLDFSLIPTILTEALRVTKKEVIVLLPSKCLKGTNQRIKTLILGFASSGLSVEIVSKDQLTIFKLTKNHQSVDYPLNFHRNPLLSSQGSQASLKQTFWFDQNHYNVCQQFYDLYLPPLSSFLKNPLFCSTFGKTYGESQKTNNYPETQMLHIYNESVPVNSLGTNLFLMSLDDKIGLLSQHDWYRLLNNLDILLIPKSKDVALLSETFKLEPERIQTLSPCLENVIPQIIGPNLKTHLKKVLIFIDDLLLAEKMERIIGILKNHAIEVTLLYSAPIKPIDQLNYFESHILIPKPFDLYPVQTKSRWYSYFATQNEIQKRLFSQNTQHLYALNQKRRKLFKKLLTGSPLKAIKYKGLESLPPDFLVQFDLVCTLGENRSQIQFLLSAMLYGSIPIIETNAFSDLFTQENSIALNNLDNLIRELKNQPETTKELSKEAVKTAQTYSLELQCRTLLKAAQTYKEALEKDPAFRLKHLERKAFTALSYLDIENTKKMLKEIEEIKPETLFFQYYRAKLTALEGNIDAAILELERLKIILEEDRTTKFMLIDLYLLLGKLYFSIGERTQAIKLWSAVQKEDPFNTESAYLLTILT